MNTFFPCWTWSAKLRAFDCGPDQLAHEMRLDNFAAIAVKENLCPEKASTWRHVNVDMTCHDMTWHHMTCECGHDMTWHRIIRHEQARSEMNALLKDGEATRLFDQYRDNERVWQVILERCRSAPGSTRFRSDRLVAVKLGFTYLCMNSSTNNIERIFSRLSLIETTTGTSHGLNRIVFASAIF